eukprot:15479693-Alexandrium_andersonii.AAC.1
MDSESFVLVCPPGMLCLTALVFLVFCLLFLLLCKKNSTSKVDFDSKPEKTDIKFFPGSEVYHTSDCQAVKQARRKPEKRRLRSHCACAA